jgi:hypothetical protein
MPVSHKSLLGLENKPLEEAPHGGGSSGLIAVKMSVTSALGEEAQRKAAYRRPLRLCGGGERRNPEERECR